MSVSILEGFPYLSAPLYMLLELDEGMLPRIYQMEADPDPQPLFADTELSTHLDQGPWLVRITPEGQYLAAYRQEPGQWPGILLASKQPMEALLAHLRRMLIVQFDGQRKGVLRYYDPRVASYLFPATEASGAWLGPIEQFVWHGSTWPEQASDTCHWRTLLRQASSPSVMPSRGLVLDKMQVAALEQQQIEAFAYECWRTQSQADFPQVLEYLQQGLASGFDEEQSLNTYLQLRLAHPRHLQHPQIAAGQVQWRLQQLQAWLEATPAPMENQG